MRSCKYSATTRHNGAPFGFLRAIVASSQTRLLLWCGGVTPPIHMSEAMVPPHSLGDGAVTGLAGPDSAVDRAVDGGPENGRNERWTDERKTAGRPPDDRRTIAPCGRGLERMLMHLRLPTSSYARRLRQRESVERSDGRHRIARRASSAMQRESNATHRRRGLSAARRPAARSLRRAEADERSGVRRYDGRGAS